MLMRLQSSLGRDDLCDRIVLLPQPKKTVIAADESSNSLTLVVGYNGSPKSHAALDISLLIAHQTRLATSKQVTVQVVYVLEQNQSNQRQDIFRKSSIDAMSIEFLSASGSKSGTPVLTRTKLKTSIDSCSLKETFSEYYSFEQAESILWQARCLVEEWRDAFAAHLRFGSVATELRKVVESKSADILFLGCKSSDEPIVQKLGCNFPCAVLGIPDTVD
ncbi:universal stress protein [Planktothrix sp. FACHB-1355]|uniref:Universal stress protein n=2 Tax=Cyanophyceae TaxID=3028117 RepID=A0A926ZJP8_9CYAN|nr:universal stress protein [Aerosakkonema funiforme FACHB-1375]MBD3561009.1 universal stress protein [Planktothrix sp. FACHB-1355]